MNTFEWEFTDRVRQSIGCGGRGGKRKITNADRIRNMTDEELVEWICKIDVDCDRCLIASKRYKACRVGNCEKAWLEWLKQEVDSG